MIDAASRKAGILLILLWAQLCFSAWASGAAGPDQDDSYIRMEFKEITSRAQSFDGKRVCVKGGLIRHGILVAADRINQPYKCTIEVEKFDPATIEGAAQLCIRHYGRHIYPRIHLWHFPPETGLKPEACVIVCGVFRVKFEPVEHVPQLLEVDTVQACK